MKKLFSLLLLSLSALSIVNARAGEAEGATIENVKFSGSGCLEGQALAILTPDQRILSLLFDNYIVEAGGDTNSKRGYKECMVQLELSVPENTRVVIEKIDYRGYAMLPNVGRMNFSSSYFIDIPELNYKTQTFTKKQNRIGEIDEDLFFDHKIKNKVLKSKCGHDFNFNFESELMAMTNAHNDEVYVSLDSIDTGIDFHISYEACEQNFRRDDQQENMRRRRRIRSERRNRDNITQQHRRNMRRMRAGNTVRSRRCSARDCVNTSTRPNNRRTRNSDIDGESQQSRRHHGNNIRTRTQREEHRQGRSQRNRDARRRRKP